MEPFHVPWGFPLLSQALLHARACGQWCYTTHTRLLVTPGITCQSLLPLTAPSGLALTEGTPVWGCQTAPSLREMHLWTYQGAALFWLSSCDLSVLIPDVQSDILRCGLWDLGHLRGYATTRG